ncbi:MarR family winged helix-turn-helix transcriptional regulator [Leucobacter komagatae]|uniref:MarR family winged helix-turn-helix transcriptional regulator n=1 Tax=Leucobacter komagatae TaxID=55969 RepID=UPI0006989CAC|nr:MarR family winged helix-turn-helix transcriptional regulator [Leucobacter komagatae]
MPSSPQPQSSAARPGISTSIALSVIASQAQQPVDAVLRRHGLNLRKYGALRHISASPGVSFSELARRFDITVQSMHTLVAALITADLLESAIPNPGEAAELSITEAGRSLLAQLATDIAAIDAELFGEAASPEWRALGEAVTRVTMAELYSSRD